ncbi:ATP-grasp domain-containing protein [Natronoglycomyces albus]|uniref:ATP-grasp domain-containing protein n=1 Tax=Natronoglycomyces albus TaxID=2811108 RepID=A0A895XMT1_9ACTN|nr:hypothetical protein [Natronoglycomyces albus]QSB04843.1 hypothetical protein JQS30_13890 [Natronoglycomyces albus]
MSLLVLHRFGLEPFHYATWVADADGDVVLLADRNKILAAGEECPVSLPGYAHFEAFDDFDSASVYSRALELAEKYQVTHVLAYHEADLIRAARLRDQLGLEGQKPADVPRWRDKVLMKRRLRAAGIEVAPHELATDVERVRAFGDRHGLPLVFKSRDGYGSIGLRIVRSSDELDELLRQEYPTGAVRRQDLLMEAFVPGKMCHVDGLVAQGRTVMAWPSQYQYDLASFQQDPKARIDVTLDEDDPLTPRLLALCDEALTALQGPQTYPFHAEIFHTPDDRLVFCEVACRPGGARIREAQTAVFGVNPAEYAARAHVGLDLPGVPAQGRMAPRQMSGQALMMKRPGRVVAMPQYPAEDWVEFCGLFAEPGQVLGDAAISSDFLIAAVASAPSRVECERRLRQLGDRFEAEVVIEPMSAEGHR